MKKLMFAIVAAAGILGCVSDGKSVINDTAKDAKASYFVIEKKTNQFCVISIENVDGTDAIILKRVGNDSSNAKSYTTEELIGFLGKASDQKQVDDLIQFVTREPGKKFVIKSCDWSVVTAGRKLDERSI